MTTNPDGRVARRQTNRGAVIDAVIGLHRDGESEPTIEDVARASDVSTRSIYRYFHHREGLIREALQQLAARVEEDYPLADIGEGDLAGRIDRFTRHRVGSHIELAPLVRAVMRVEQEQRARDDGLAPDPDRERLVQQFAHEFDELDGAELSRALVIAQLPFEFLSLDYLHRIRGADADEMIIILNHLLTVHFAALAAR